MISTIQNKEELNYFLPQLISSYKLLFSEPPFNNSNITDKYARIFFTNTFENGLIFINTSSRREIISGFRTIIKSETFKDFHKINLLTKGSVYLSCIWVSKELRGRGLGNELMNYTLRTIKKEFNADTVFVRTRSDTPEILSLLEKKGFKKVKTYPVIINYEKLNLIFHKLSI